MGWTGNAYGHTMVPPYGPKTCPVLTSSSPAHPGDASILEPLEQGPALSQHFILGLQSHPCSITKINRLWDAPDPLVTCHPSPAINTSPLRGDVGGSPKPPTLPFRATLHIQQGKSSTSQLKEGRGCSGGGDELTARPAGCCWCDRWSRCCSRALRTGCLVPPRQQPVISEAAFPARTP